MSGVACSYSVCASKWQRQFFKKQGNQVITRNEAVNNLLLCVSRLRSTFAELRPGGTGSGGGAERENQYHT